MKGTYLGEFEELVLLIIAALYDNAYGVAVQRELLERCNRKATISTVHSAMHRLSQKGYLESRYSDATPARGGRRKLLFRVTVAGEKALIKSREQRNGIWDSIPKIAFQR